MTEFCDDCVCRVGEPCWWGKAGKGLGASTAVTTKDDIRSLIKAQPLPSDVIEIKGLRVSVREFEDQLSKRLIFKLADSEANDMIEAAEVANGPDKLLPGDVVLDVPSATPIWGDCHSPWTAEGQSTLIVGPDGTGKTTICEHYSKARIGLEGWAGDLLGDPVKLLPEDQNVLYLAADRPIQVMQGFGRGVNESHREMLHDRLRIWPGLPPMDLTTSAGQSWLLAMIEKFNIGLLIIDSRKDVGNVMDPREVNRLNQLLKRLDADGVEVVIPHHPIQSAESPKHPPRITDVMGYREVYSGTGSVLMLKGKAGEGQAVLHQVKPIMEKHDKVHIAFDYSTGRANLSILQVTNHGDGNLVLTQTDDRKLAVREEVLHDLRAAGHDGMEKTPLTGTGARGAERRAELPGLEEDGLIHHHRVGRSQIYWAIEFDPPEPEGCPG
jgi:hypothetical protein